MADEVIETRALAPQAVQPTQVMELSTTDILNRLKKIEEVQRQAMKQGIDYGVVPGTKGKPTLFKAGAEKLCVLFRLDPQFETTTEEHPDGHKTVASKCVVYHQVSGERLGGASAECSSREKKYAYRKGGRICPDCGKSVLMKSKRNPNVWWCNTYKEGCGGEFPLADERIQDAGDRIKNEDVADEFPTVRRMAEKRALIAAVRLVTGASAIFDEPMADAKEEEPDDLNASFDREHPPSDDALQEAAAEYQQAFKDEMALREPDAGVKATRIALIRKAKDKLGEEMGIKWLSEATKEIGKTSDTLTIDEMLKLSERISNLKAPKPSQKEARQ